MAGGIAARDAAPYKHARVNPIEEQKTMTQSPTLNDLFDDFLTIPAASIPGT
jgi:hypothetical protein